MTAREKRAGARRAPKRWRRVLPQSASPVQATTLGALIAAPSALWLLAVSRRCATYLAAKTPQAFSDVMNASPKNVAAFSNIATLTMASFAFPFSIRHTLAI
jgi:hypothetical protein